MESQPALPTPEAPSPVPRARRASARNAWQGTLLIVVTLGLAFLGWQWHETRQELRQTQAELASRLAQSAELGNEARTLARQAQEQIQAQQAKLGAVEARLVESQSQQAALEAVYQEFSRARDERALAEVEQTIGIASQQLLLGGNVPAALAALQSAESRLGNIDRAQLMPLRKSIARDIERLKALPLADITAIALQLETMIGRVDAMPLGFEHEPPKTQNAPAISASAPATHETQSAPAEASTPLAATSGALSFLRNIAREIWVDFRKLIRIERLDRPDPALLAPTHAAFLRENVRLRLLSARLALMQRDSQIFAEDLRQLQQWLNRYFDPSARPVALMLGELKEMERAQLQLELPSLEETEASLRSLKLSQR